MCFSLQSTNNARNFPVSHWEAAAPDSKRDLIIKKIAITLLALMNFAALGTALYYIISYCPLPGQALIVSPFIVGVLAALSTMQFPTFGVSSVSYTQYLNPTALFGRVMAYIFFGPLMYAMNYFDWTPYHDAIHANKISKDLEEHSFDQIGEQYGKNFDNLIKYGFIHENYRDAVMTLWKSYQPLNNEIRFWKQEGLENCVESQLAKQRMQSLESDWQNLKHSFQYPFPHPEKPRLDFSKTSTTIKLHLRKYFCFHTPLHHIAKFKA